MHPFIGNMSFSAPDKREKKHILDSPKNEDKNKKRKTEKKIDHLESICAEDVHLFHSIETDNCVTINNMMSKMMLDHYSSNLKRSNESTLVSPFSLLSAFSMLLIGLTGKTLDEIQKELLIKNKHKLFNNIVAITKTFGENIKTNNFILTKDSVNVKKTYLNDVKKLGSLLTFSQEEIPELVGKVNEIVDKNTNSKINDLLKPDDVNGDTFLVLINTLLMDLEWSKKFKKMNTQEELFYELAGPRCEILGKSRKVSMMNHYEKELGYYESDAYQVLRIPYNDENFSMVVVLPNQKYRPFHLAASEFSKCLKNLKKQWVNVKLPSFEISTKLDLVPFFKKNGMKQMFEYMHADDMIMRYDEQKVTAIRQNNVVKNNESGTSIVSATVITAMCRESMVVRIKPKKVYNFYATHPFAYHIVHKSGLILASGFYL